MEVGSPETAEDASDTLNLVLEEDIPANLDYYVLLSRKGYFKDADQFFDVHLKKHSGWFPIIWEYYNSQAIRNRRFRPADDVLIVDASATPIYDPEETELLRNMVSIWSRVPSAMKKLHGILEGEVIRDIEVCGMLVYIRIRTALSSRLLDLFPSL